MNQVAGWERLSSRLHTLKTIDTAKQVSDSLEEATDMSDDEDTLPLLPAEPYVMSHEKRNWKIVENVEEVNPGDPAARVRSSGN